jgi:hypothetical protein
VCELIGSSHTAPIRTGVRPLLSDGHSPRQLPLYPNPTLLTLSRRSRPSNMATSQCWGLPAGPPLKEELNRQPGVQGRGQARGATCCTQATQGVRTSWIPFLCSVAHLDCRAFVSLDILDSIPILATVSRPHANMQLHPSHPVSTIHGMLKNRQQRVPPRPPASTIHRPSKPHWHTDTRHSTHRHFILFAARRSSLPVFVLTDPLQICFRPSAMLWDRRAVARPHPLTPLWTLWSWQCSLRVPSYLAR